MWSDVDAAVLPAPSRDLARFRLNGTDCIVVALEEGRHPDGVLGTFKVGAQSYAVVGQAEPPAAPDPINLLTARELEIAMLVASGHESKAIARRLRISFHTVRVHLGRIYGKLGLHKQTELAARIAARLTQGGIWSASMALLC